MKLSATSPGLCFLISVTLAVQEQTLLEDFMTNIELTEFRSARFSCCIVTASAWYKAEENLSRSNHIKNEEIIEAVQERRASISIHLRQDFDSGGNYDRFFCVWLKNPNFNFHVIFQGY